MILYEEDVKKFICDFCSKHQTNVKRVITGTRGTAICNECVDKCSILLTKAGVKK